ncbi:MAG TPA: D-hexose-6-phosphate mutarotase, partial [Usitatibacter sp.]
RDGASAIATLQGAHLVSWIPSGGEEGLYVSERSPFEAGRPIRGGLPVVFPQFADRGPLAQHGFARTQAWSFTGASESEEGTRASFALESSPRTAALWTGAFRLELTVTLGGPRLDVELRVANTGDAAFAFNAALHTYLRVSEAAAVRLEGLRGARYSNRGESAVSVEAREFVTAGEPIDRVYLAAPPATRLEDAGRILRIEQRGFADTVVWNPGRDRTAQMADMPPDGFRHMLCVEAAAFEVPVQLGRNAAWTGGQSIVIS